MTHLCNQGYITIREHRYSKLEIPTQYFQEHFASFPKIIFQSFESALNFALNAHFFCDFHTPCFRPVLCRFFFSFFYNFICIQWISLVKNPLSVFPIACVSLRKEIIYATKKNLRCHKMQSYKQSAKTISLLFL